MLPLDAVDVSESDGVIVYWGTDDSVDRLAGLLAFGSRMRHSEFGT